MSASPQVRAREWDTFTGSTLAGLAELESYAVRLKAMVILGHDNVAITLRSHDVVRIVEQSRAVAEGMIARLAEGVRLEISVRRRPAVAMCDRRVLSGVITSLLDNAARYAARTGASRVTVEVVGAAPNTGRQVVISVGDDGAKFTREDLDRLGGQGERGQAAAGTDGTGLTLWYLWQAVEQMNGEFAVRNRPEGEDGKVFEIRLPASQMPTDD
jgi:signal transduction histidine kinase